MRLRELGVIGIALLLALTVAGRPAAAVDGGNPGPTWNLGDDDVTADSLPTAQHNGVTWAQVIIGNTVYVGGQFTSARPAGAALGVGEVPRSNLMAFDITTGALLPFAVATNAEVLTMAASPDRKRLYIGGVFTTVGGAFHDRVAAIDVATGQVDPTFTGDANSTVRAMAVDASGVYIGGSFGVVGNQNHGRLAKLTTSGAPVSGWSPNADDTVRALAITPDGSKLVVGGSQDLIDSTSTKGIGAVSTATGDPVVWRVNQTVSAYGDAAGMWSVQTDGKYVYGTAFNYHGIGNLEGMWKADPTDGHVVWIEDCHGDTYSSFAMNGLVYTAGHAHYCGNDGGWLDDTTYQRAMAFSQDATGTLTADMSPGHKGADHTGVAAPSIVDWFPALNTGTATGLGQAAWTVTGNGTYLVLGGEFPKVNGQQQQGNARFVIRPYAPRILGPRIPAASWTPTVTRTSSATTITIGANWDIDDLNLRYQLVRNGVIVTQLSTGSTFWSLPTITLTDSGQPAGTRYAVIVTDSSGNRVTSPTVTA